MCYPDRHNLRKVSIDTKQTIILPYPPRISDLWVRFRDADFRPQMGGRVFGRYLQCKTKENDLKREREDG
jgi:hypothetical protein